MWDLAFIKTVSSKQFAIVCYLLLLAFLYLMEKYFVWDRMKIKYFELLIKKHSAMLKKNSNPFEIIKLSSLLVDLFNVYEKKIISPILLSQLFPSDGSNTQVELPIYEQKMKNRLAPYYSLLQNIERYYDRERSITITEFIRRIRI